MYYLDEGTGVLIWVLLAATAHEIGHITAAAALGGRVEALSLTASGAELRFRYQNELSYGRENIVALSGPAMNLLLGLLALQIDAYPLAAASLGLGITNMLPVSPLDGGRVLSNIIAVHFSLCVTDQVLAVAAGILGGVLTGLGVGAAVKYANFTLLIFAGWLLTVNLTKRKK